MYENLDKQELPINTSKSEAMQSSKEDAKDDSEAEQEVEEAQGLSSPTVYEIISLEGQEEMDRPAKSLWYSGIIAGLAISMSLYVMAALRIKLEGTGLEILEKFGYSVGFLIVILSRLQLFTENTITPILPALSDRSSEMLWRVARLWGIVFVANMCGTFIAAAMPLLLPMFSSEHVAAMLDISMHFAERPLMEVLVSAVPAGFLVAIMVWMLPSSKHFEIWTITMMTFTIAVLDTSHVIVGSGELFMVWLDGQSSFLEIAPRLILAALGNIIGGTVVFAGLAYAQVKSEM